MLTGITKYKQSSYMNQCDNESKTDDYNSLIVGYKWMQ